MVNSLTRIRTINFKNHIKYYVRFGRRFFLENIAINQENEYYEPNQLVGYVQWQAGEHGSRVWRFMIFKTIKPRDEDSIQSIEGISPGVRIILDLEGAMKVRLILNTINQVEAVGLHPADISPAYYGYVHQRIVAKNPYHFYEEEQHESFLKEQEVTS